jgi:membrane protease YdiL (CAAX protease family)
LKKVILFSANGQLQTFIFTFLHAQYVGDWVAIFGVFLIGAIAGYLTWKSNNLFPAIVLHIIANLIVVIWWLNVH